MRVADRQKQRREYLKKKAGTFGKNLGGNLLFAGVFIFTMMCGCGTVLLLLGALIFASFGFGEARYCAFGAVILTLLTFASWRTLRMADGFVERVREEGNIPYVPPVTPNTLPAEEVLVRGAQEPTEPSNVLLRAAGESADKPEELLRASVSREEEVL